MLWINGFLFLVALLAIFHAPAYPFWFLAIGVTEWGHWFALAALILFFLSDRSTLRGRLAAVLSAFSVCLFLSSLVRAQILAQRLPAELSFAFPVITDLRKPLNLIDLLRGVRSPEVRMTTRVYAQKDGEDLRMDIYEPDRPHAALPAVVFVHGGSWQGGERSELPALNRYLAARGCLVVSVDYRLAPRSPFPAAIEDVRTAIAYLKSHAKELGLDKNDLVLMGRSAGGQIALMTAYAGQDPAIRGVIAFYTPNDLVFAYSKPSNPLIINSQKVLACYVGGSGQDLQARLAVASPFDFVGPRTPPTLLIHGVRDELVWSVHSERLSRKLAQAGRPYYYLRLPWATHGCDANLSGPSGQLSTFAIERFLAYVRARS